ncbi:MAG TPA: hypothetical protein VHY08_09880 [Bacillota bacterium]|nr:hypothetical protein [Bacillota bacterium]
MSTPDLIAAVNQLLDQMEQAYVQKNLPFIVGLHEDPVVAIDITRNLYEFFTPDRLGQELGNALGPLSEISAVFTDREIISEKDTVIIHTNRTVGAKELPVIAKVNLLMVLKRSGVGPAPGNYRITSMTVLKEDYIPAPGVSAP